MNNGKKKIYDSIVKNGGCWIMILITIVLILTSCQRKTIPYTDAIGKLKSYDTAAFDYLFVEGIRQKLLGNPGEALKYLEQCVKINPQSDAAYFHMAQIILSTGNTNEGKKYAIRALSINPSNPWYLIMLAGTYFQEDNIDSSIYFYEEAVRKFPEKEDLQMTLGTLYSENRQYENANFVFENLDKKYGPNKTSTIATVKNMILAEKFDEAEEKLNLLLKEYPDEIALNGLLAEIYRGKGLADKAMEVYSNLLERNPNNPETQLSLCEFLINEKRYEELIGLLNNVILNDAITREDKISLFAKIIEIPEIVKSSAGRLHVSLMIFEAANRDDYVIMLLRPELLTAEGKIGEAIERLEEIISDYPDNYYAWEKTLVLYFQERNFKKLEKRGEECALKFNRSFLAKILYATGAGENGNYDKALEEIKKALIIAGDNKELILQALTLRADIYYRMKDFQQAFKTFDEAMTYNREDYTILNNYAYYLAEQDMKLKEAEIMAKKVIDNEKNNNTFLDTYAWVLFKRGKNREAQKIMEKIISSGDEPDAEWYEHYGFILKKRRKCSDAVKSWEMALKLDSTKNGLKREIQKCHEK